MKLKKVFLLISSLVLIFIFLSANVSAELQYQLGIIGLGTGVVSGSEESTTPIGGEILTFDWIWDNGWGLHVSPFNLIYYDQDLPAKKYTKTYYSLYGTRTATIYSPSEVLTDYYTPIIV
ncbi:MAG: hypothetical protein GF384_08155, partial [Elusimicrobia bacterium]|nr:hypothetical protein [Elusimicrobiota bacterium]